MITLKRILVPHDFSETSEAAMKYASELARIFGAKLHVLHVSDNARAEMAMETPHGLDTRLDEALRERQLKRLLKIAIAREMDEFNPELNLRSGRPHAEIVRYARERDVDLIVMGTHGRGFVAHAVMGSVAEKVVRHAVCPVLTVHGPTREFVMADMAEDMDAAMAAVM